MGYYDLYILVYHVHFTFYCMHGLVLLSVGVICMSHILSTMLYISVSVNSSLLGPLIIAFVL